MRAYGQKRIRHAAIVNVNITSPPLCDKWNPTNMGRKPLLTVLDKSWQIHHYIRIVLLC